MWSGRLRSEFAWLARRLGWGHSPIRRRTDRVEAAIMLASVVLVLSSVPLALAAGYGVYQQNMTASAGQRTTLRNVPATLDDSAMVVTGTDGQVFVAAHAQWPSANGAHAGLIRVPLGTSAGSVVRIWTDARGVPTSAPADQGTALGRGAVAAGIMLGVLILALTLFVRLVRWQLDRRRVSALDAEWDLVGPLWTKQAS